MKRKCSIFAIAVSTVLFLILAVVPHHHHHRGIACAVIELCEQDNAVNDEHTRHSDADGENSHDESCVAESKFTIPSSVDETKYKLSTDDNDTSLPSVLFLAGELFSYRLGNSFIETDYGEHILNYISTEASQSHGLRAPPTILS